MLLSEGFYNLAKLSILSQSLWVLVSYSFKRFFIKPSNFYSLFSGLELSVTCRCKGEQSHYLSLLSPRSSLSHRVSLQVFTPVLERNARWSTRKHVPGLGKPDDPKQKVSHAAKKTGLEVRLG